MRSDKTLLSWEVMEGLQSKLGLRLNLLHPPPTIRSSKQKGSIIYPVLLSSKEKRIDSLSIKNNEEGKLIVMVDGACNGDTKEELLLSSSLDGQWNQENENITMIQNVSYNTQLFEYCKIYDVALEHKTFTCFKR
ncbi:MAG: hypothetical protein U0T81_06155 [Saprospiraceae bacterium]